MLLARLAPRSRRLAGLCSAGGRVRAAGSGGGGGRFRAPPHPPPSVDDPSDTALSGGALRGAAPAAAAAAAAVRWHGSPLLRLPRPRGLATDARPPVFRADYNNDGHDDDDDDSDDDHSDADASDSDSDSDFDPDSDSDDGGADHRHPHLLHNPPLSFTPNPHSPHASRVADALARRESRRIYRGLLRHARALHARDDICGAYVRWRAGELFRKHRHETSARRRQRLIKDGRKHLRLLGRANSGRSRRDRAALQKVVAYAYGARGVVQHILKDKISMVKRTRSLADERRRPGRRAPTRADPRRRWEKLPPEMQPLVAHCAEEALAYVLAQGGRHDGGGGGGGQVSPAKLSLSKAKRRLQVRKRQLQRDHERWTGVSLRPFVEARVAAYAARGHKSSRQVRKHRRLLESALGLKHVVGRRRRLLESALGVRHAET